MRYYVERFFEGVMLMFFILASIEVTVFVFCVAKEFLVKSYNYCKEHCFQVNHQEEDVNIPLNNPPQDHLGIELAAAYNATAEHA